MKDVTYIFENSKGQTVRYLNWQGPELFVVRTEDARRIDFVESTDELEDKKIPFELITKLSKTEINSKDFAIRDIGRVRAVSHINSLQSDIAATPEDDDRMPILLKYTAAGYIAVILLLIGSSWIFERYFNKTEEPTVVTVIQQNRKEVHTVEARVRPLPKKTRISNRTVRAKSKVNNKSVASHGKGTKRHGTQTKNIGALGALGGFSKSFHGAGGLNINAKTDNAGIGYGGKAARGGHERSLVGKGLVQGGAGGTQKLQGYGGYGTSGKGGGRPGYGSMKLAGSSGAYFTPLADESLVEGGLDRDQINAVIQRNIGQITYCYEQELQSKPNLSGRVAVKFVIDGGGHVNIANVANTSLRSSRVESCILSKLRSWRFPKPTGNVKVRVTYPFQLKRLSQG